MGLGAAASPTGSEREEVAPCPDCGEEFKTLELFVKHRRTTHLAPPRASRRNASVVWDSSGILYASGFESLSQARAFVSRIEQGAAGFSPGTAPVSTPRKRRASSRPQRARAPADEDRDGDGRTTRRCANCGGSLAGFHGNTKFCAGVDCQRTRSRLNTRKSRSLDALDDALADDLLKLYRALVWRACVDGTLPAGEALLLSVFPNRTVLGMLKRSAA